MEYKSLFLGVLFAIGVFAMKSGAGSHYYLTKTKGWNRKAGLLLCLGLVYLALFLIISLVIQRTNLITFFGLVQQVVRWAMTIHFVLAATLMVWGLILIGRTGEDHRQSIGWLALVAPCPVCLTVIFFTLAFLTAYFPDHPFRIALYAYAGFMGVHAITLLGLWAWQSRWGSSPEFTLGAAMLGIAVYFLLSVFIMPHFSELERIYRLALPPVEAPIPEKGQAAWLLAGLGACFAIGFCWKWKGDRFRCR
jgi:predicted transporter